MSLRTTAFVFLLLTGQIASGAAAIPLHGSYLVSPDAFSGMEWHINVFSIGEEKHDAAEKV